MPNLRPLSRYPMVPSPQQAPVQQLWFSTFVENHGDWPFEIIGHPETNADAPGQQITAQQCVRWEGPQVNGGARVCLRYEPVGALVYHPIHNHFHLDGLARYRLLADRGGVPGEELRNSGKVGFCLTDTFDMTPSQSPVPLGNALAQAVHDTARQYADRWYIECTHFYGLPYPGVRMGISPGWKDMYSRLIPGQGFPIADLPDGTYWIETTLNSPEAPFLRETDLSDNLHVAPVCIYHSDTIHGTSREAREGAC